VSYSDIHFFAFPSSLILKPLNSPGTNQLTTSVKWLIRSALLSLNHHKAIVVMLIMTLTSYQLLVNISSLYSTLCFYHRFSKGQHIRQITISFYWGKPVYQHVRDLSLLLHPISADGEKMGIANEDIPVLRNHLHQHVSCPAGWFALASIISYTPYSVGSVIHLSVA